MRKSKHIVQCACYCVKHKDNIWHLKYGRERYIKPSSDLPSCAIISKTYWNDEGSHRLPQDPSLLQKGNIVHFNFIKNDCNYVQVVPKKILTKIEFSGAKFPHKHDLGVFDPTWSSLETTKKRFSRHRGCQLLIIQPLHRGSSSILLVIFLGQPVGPFFDRCNQRPSFYLTFWTGNMQSHLFPMPSMLVRIKSRGNGGMKATWS